MTDSTPAAKPEKIRAVKGMNDILPPASAQWEWFEAHVRALMDAFAYRNIRTPILEHTALFVRGIGEVTDVVEKEMYSFEDRSDRHGQAEHLSMRPENTASVVRACIESSLLHSGGKRLYYMGPMFRRERPQRGRYRQFHQLGAEALGFPGADMDAEMILLAVALFRRIGITGWTLEINSLGQPAERARHRTELIAWFQAHENQLDEDARRRLHSNPLRILDTKNPAMQPLVEAAPKLIDFLGADSLAHLKMVQDMLDANDVPWQLNPRLVRGLDYYNLTVFEFVTQSLGAQGTLCAGGRYDYLFEQVGGAATPAVGWALGIERVLELLREQGTEIPEKKPLAYAIIPDAQGIAAALRILQGLRAANISVQMNACAAQGAPGSMKSQFRKADASGAEYALIFGPDELARGELTLKALRDGSGQQRTFALDDIAALAQALQSPVSQ